jgi:ornithine--oxo-acid transaminase
LFGRQQSYGLHSVALVYRRPGDHGSTFGGNPLAAAIGIAAVQVIIDEKMPENALLQGDYIRTNLSQIAKKYPFMKSVRGRGLFLGME